MGKNSKNSIAQIVIADKNIETAKNIIISVIKEAGYKVVSIILFGSHARGDYRQDSDYDIFVVIDRELSKEDWKIVYRAIYKKLGSAYIIADVIIKSQSLYEHQQKGTGFLSYYVNKEGIAL